MTKSFQLQFHPADIAALAERYGPRQDDDALTAGCRIRNGASTRANFETIVRWKTGGRGITRLARNTDEEIADALSLAVRAKTARAAVAVLVGLDGVAVPVASAISARWKRSDAKARTAPSTSTSSISKPASLSPKRTESAYAN
jgi:hypothetical protein